MNWPWNRNKQEMTSTGNAICYECGGEGGSSTTRMVAELPEPINLSGTGKLDTYSGTWIFIRGFLQNSLQELRESNDSVNKDDLQTAVLRGQIKMAKKILELPNPKPTIPEQDADGDETEF